MTVGTTLSKAMSTTTSMMKGYLVDAMSTNQELAMMETTTRLTAGTTRRVLWILSTPDDHNAGELVNLLTPSIHEVKAP